MSFKHRTLSQIADMICGNGGGEVNYFRYRSSSFLTEFFQDCETDYRHDGSTRSAWVADVLQKILAEPWPDANTPPESFLLAIKMLMDKGDATNEAQNREGALAVLNAALVREGFEAFYAEDGLCYLRHVATNQVAKPAPNPHRPFSIAELKKREQLSTYLAGASEDELIQEILLPLFRQLGFHRVSVAGHRDKALEYGKDIWMRYTLPTQHILYFGLQVKKGKLDAAGMSKADTANIAEIHNQALMMLGHEIFDPEIGRSVLVDHAFIVAGGEITKAARNWLGNKLDASLRRQIIFMDRDDILNLFVVTSLPLPAGALPAAVSQADTDDLPF